MTTIKKTIGRLPQNLGPWEQGRAYKRRNRVNCLGSELESLIENNTDCPCTYDEASGKVVVSPKWRIVTDGRASYEFSRQYPNMKEDFENRIKAGEQAMVTAVKEARESTKTVIDEAREQTQEVIDNAKDDVAKMVDDARKEVSDFIDLAQKGYRPEIDEESETLNLVCLGGAVATIDAESETLELTF